VAKLIIKLFLYKKYLVVQKRCANDCSECNDFIKGGNATGKDKERCSHYLGCWQCSGNLCNGAMPHASFSFVVLAFAILLGGHWNIKFYKLK
jgi:hypothetical protein